jgi:oligopeptide transport system permease protein
VLRHALLRSAVLFATFLCIVTATFFLMRAAPGGPFDGERRLPPEIEANLRAAYHLDEPLVQQYARFLAMLARGDLGPSFKQKDFDVNELIAEGLPVSLAVGGLALALAVSLGIGAGTLSAVRHGRAADGFVMGAAALGLALPSFVVAPLLALAFGVRLRWLPVAGWGTPAHLVLPAIALALPFVAAIARLTRAGVVESLAAPFVRTARSKGLPERHILFRHVLPNALTPVLSFLGPATAGLLAGSVVIEQVFALPGLGRYFVQAALNRDYTLVMGAVVVYSAMILAFNLMVDLAYVRLDPRQRGSHAP